MEYNDYDNLMLSIGYFVDRVCSPSWNLGRSIINFHDLTYVYDGQATYFINGAEYSLKKGDIIYIPCGSFREAYTDVSNPMKCYAFSFTCCQPESTDKNVSLPLPSTFRIGTFSELMELYRDFSSTWLEKSPGYMLKAKALFMLILHKLICITGDNGSPSISDYRIKKIKDYILLNYRAKIKINHLAKLVDLNPAYLGTIFKKNNGYSLKEYINKVRINNAESLLSTGEYSVSEASVQCGFDDIFYFSKVFKQYKGYPPSSTVITK